MALKIMVNSQSNFINKNTMIRTAQHSFIKDDEEEKTFKGFEVTDGLGK